MTDLSVPSDDQNGQQPSIPSLTSSQKKLLLAALEFERTKNVSWRVSQSRKHVSLHLHAIHGYRASADNLYYLMLIRLDYLRSHYNRQSYYTLTDAGRAVALALESEVR